MLFSAKLTFYADTKIVAVVGDRCTAVRFVVCCGESILHRRSKTFVSGGGAEQMGETNGPAG